MTAFTLEEARDVLATALPGCVRSLGVSVESLGEGKATLRMPAGEQATREGNIFGGQALSVLADSAMCFAIWRAAARTCSRMPSWCARAARWPSRA